MRKESGLGADPSRNYLKIIDHGNEKDLHLEMKNMESEEMVDNANEFQDLLTLPRKQVQTYKTT